MTKMGMKKDPRPNFGTWTQKSASKYGNCPTTIDWHGTRTSFQSRKEANRATELLLLERAKKITNLERQVTYRIVIYGNLVCKYIADFVYTDSKGIEHVEDVKGKRTDVYSLKKKLMKAVLGIHIEEV